MTARTSVAVDAGVVLYASAPRVATVGQGWVLISTTWLAVAAAAALAPAAPAMALHFRAVPHATELTQVAIGLPALFVVLLGFPFGWLIDRIGRRPVLLVALVAYAMCGTLPFWLDSLPAILASRAGVGIAEAAVVGAAMALLGDYFQGARLDRWAAIQGGTSTVAAIIFLSISSVLGGVSWRAPFLIYAAPIGIALLVARLVWEPGAERADALDVSATPAGTTAGWGIITVKCGVSLLAAISFYIVLIQLPFLLTARGFGVSQAAIGAVAGAITAPLGAVVFRRLEKAAATTRLALSFGASALGLLVIATGTSYPIMLAGAAINGIGSGIVLPTLITWTLNGLSAAERGRVSGLWNASFSLGQFLSPILFLAAAQGAGGAAPTMGAAGIALAAAAVCAAIFSLAGRRRAAQPLRAAA